jgi:hypothetical protein
VPRVSNDRIIADQLSNYIVSSYPS